MKLLLLLILIISISLSNVPSLISENYHDPLDYKCATFKPEIKRQIMANFIMGVKTLDESERMRIADKILNGEITSRPEELILDTTFEYGNFLVHYDTLGVNAVPADDKDNNGVPDFVDSTAYYFERAYQVEVMELGFHSPIGDSGAGGSDAFDIYLLELGNSEGTYGYTNTDLEIRPDKGYDRYTSYIVMDNDFSPLDSFQYQEKLVPVYRTPGIDAVKITSAHEFHHAIQFRYGIEDRNAMIHEMTSTWMEYRIYPEIKDYYQYLTGLFRYPEAHPISSGSGTDGYRWSIYHHYMFRKYGDESIKRMWELVGKNVSGYKSLDSLYVEQGSSLAQEWCEFLQWMYYTGSRAIDGEYFEDAEDFPELRFNDDLVFTPQEELSTSGSLQPYELRALRVFNPGAGQISDDTLDYVFTNADTKGTIAFLSSTRAYDFYMTDYDLAGYTRVPGSDLYYFLEASDDYYCHNLMFHPGGETCSKDFVYPNPFLFSSEEDLFFPAPRKAPLYEKVKLCVYTVDMKQLYFGEHQVEVNNGCRVVIWNEIPQSISSGVYIYSLEYDGDMKLGKFVIRKF